MSAQRRAAPSQPTEPPVVKSSRHDLAKMSNQRRSQRAATTVCATIADMVLLGLLVSSNPIPVPQRLLQEVRNLPDGRRHTGSDETLDRSSVGWGLPPSCSRELRAAQAERLAVLLVRALKPTCHPGNLWAGLADYNQAHHSILVLAFVATIVLRYSIRLVSSFPLVLLVLALSESTNAPIIIITDAAVMAACGAEVCLVWQDCKLTGRQSQASQECPCYHAWGALLSSFSF